VFVDRAAPAEHLLPAAGLVPSERDGLPGGLRVLERPPDGGWAHDTGPVLMLVHGSLDRATSFGRTVRRLPGIAVVVYDRRGYQGSRGARPASSLRTHIDDLLAITRVYRDAGCPSRDPGAPRAACAVGHSVGGTVVLGAAVATAGLFSCVGAYEPSLPWLGFRRREGRRPGGDGVDAGEEAARFFERMVGEGSWGRLSEAQRAERRGDGPALLADLRAIGAGAPFDVRALRVAAVVATGGPKSLPHHLATADWLAANVATVRRAHLAQAAHGAHLSHPDAFAALVLDVVVRASHDGAVRP
jgi:pimeloyl-ACP methyl ester carboxylesterase